MEIDMVVFRESKKRGNGDDDLYSAVNKDKQVKAGVFITIHTKY